MRASSVSRIAAGGPRHPGLDGGGPFGGQQGLAQRVQPVADDTGTAAEGPGDRLVQAAALAGSLAELPGPGAYRGQRCQNAGVGVKTAGAQRLPHVGSAVDGRERGAACAHRVA